MPHLSLEEAVARYEERHGKKQVSDEMVERFLFVYICRREDGLDFHDAGEQALTDCRVDETNLREELRSILGTYCGSRAHPKSDAHQEVLRSIAYEEWLQGHLDRAWQANEHLVALGRDWVDNYFTLSECRHTECEHTFVPAPRERWHYPLGKPRLLPQPKPDVQKHSKIRIVLVDGKQYSWKLPLKRRRRKHGPSGVRARPARRVTPHTDPRQCAWEL